MRRLMAGLVAAVVAASPLLVPPVVEAAPGRVATPLRTAVQHLLVAAPSHAAGYDRTTQFGDWITQFGECDTRAVVLKAESLKPTTQNQYCTILSGRWYSYYDGRYYTSPYRGALQVDHAVPVQNAWVSGAWRWTRATRVRFYNDLGDPRSLVAVDRHDNEAKGDRSPDEWMPAHGRCRYVRAWVAVKTRWRLTVTRAEKRALSSYASSCADTTLTVTRASITLR
jgi:hypothetical protein